MIPILSQKQSLEFDKYVVESGFTTKPELIDSAGKKIAQFILEKIPHPFNEKIIIIAGPGNNGLDGMICYYYLLKYGGNAELLVCNEGIIKNKIIKSYDLNIKLIKIYSKSYKFNNDFWYVDAIFGVGLNKPLGGVYLEIIKKMTTLDKVVSIDFPSGIDCDNGKTFNFSIKPKITLGLGFYKRGYFLNDGLNHIKKLEILDIGFPKYKNGNDNDVGLIECSDIVKIMPKHENNVHKYKRGKVLIIAGSIGYTGACILSSLAAVSSGAGIVKIIAPLSLKNEYESALIEPIIKYVDDHGSGKFILSHVEEIKSEISWADSILIGPGLLSNIKFKMKLIESINKPLVLDASAFDPIISGDLDIACLPKECILTPHYSEFSKIFNIDVDELSGDPINAVNNIMDILNGRVLILKGPTTIIVDSRRKKYFMTHGHKQLSVAGTGDVLSGISVSSLAQKLTVDESALYSSFLHAECAYQYNKNISKSGLIASDLIKMMPYAMDALSDLS